MAVDVVTEAFPEVPTLAPDAYQRFIAGVADSGLRGGQLYDALVAVTALEVGATLVTRDRRALPAYRSVGVELQLVD